MSTSFANPSRIKPIVKTDNPLGFISGKWGPGRSHETRNLKPSQNLILFSSLRSQKHEQLHSILPVRDDSKWSSLRTEAAPPVAFSPEATLCYSHKNGLNYQQQQREEREGDSDMPRGAGKSRLALELAKRLNGEIISADSVQVYHGLDIGSAKPPLSDRKEVPHHLVDILDPFEDYSVGQFFEDARQATRDALDSGHVPIVTGRTGLYLRWFVYGKPDVPKASTGIAGKVHAERADFERYGEWDAAVEMVVKAGDPKARSLPVNN
ncbi:hypothetical protein SLA2020_226330 [Shorea laevis]